MVATPLIRGLLGIEIEQGGATVRFAPQLPADWPSVHVRRVPVAGALYDFDVERTPGRYDISLSLSAGVNVNRGAASAGPPPAAPRDAPSAAPRAVAPSAVVIAPALPLDAKVTRVTVAGRAHPFTIEREGDIQRVRIVIEHPAPPVRIAIAQAAGTEVSVPIVEPSPGAASEGLRILRVRPEGGALHLLIEGRGQHTYRLTIHGPRAIAATEGVTPSLQHGLTQDIAIHIAGPTDEYVRQDLRLPLK
jgi:hypothetical protein